MRRVVGALVTGALAWGVAGCSAEKSRTPISPADPPSVAQPSDPSVSQPGDPASQTPSVAQPSDPPSAQPVDPSVSQPVDPAASGEISEEHWANVEAWAQALATDDWAAMEALTAPSTPAMGYVYHMELYTRLVEGQDAAWQLRPTSYHGSDRAARSVSFEDDDGTVWDLTEIEVDSNGLVTSWSNANGPLAENLTVGLTPPTDNGSLGLSLVSAYRSGSRLIAIIQHVNFGTDDVTFHGTPFYSMPDGTIIETDGWLTVDALAPGEEVYAIFNFPEAEVGGRFETAFSYPGGPDETLNIPVPLM